MKTTREVFRSHLRGNDVDSRALYGMKFLVDLELKKGAAFVRSGKTYAANEEWRAALSDYQLGYESSHYDPVLIPNPQINLLSDKRFSDAFASYEKSYDENSFVGDTSLFDSGYYTIMTQAFGKAALGDYVSAKALFDKCLIIEPHGSDAMFYKGLIQYADGDALGARKSWLEAVDTTTVLDNRVPNYQSTFSAMSVYMYLKYFALN